MQNIPYRLSEGLFLEDSGTLLPWFKSLHQITKKGGKPLVQNKRISKIHWECDSIFDGIESAIEAHESGNGIFFLSIKYDKEFDSVEKEYDCILSVLVKKFGDPYEIGVGDYNYPFSRWRWGDICLSLIIAERFVDYVALSVSNRVIK